VRPVQQYPESDWVNPTAAPGVNKGRGSRIVFRDSGVGRQPDAPSASIPTPGSEGVTRERLLLQLMGLVFMVLIAPHEQESEPEAPSSAPNEVLSNNVPYLSPTVEMESEIWNQEKPGDRGTIAERKPEATLEPVSGDYRVGDGMHGAALLEGSRCECWDPQ
jgi:hypothetical protein